MSKDFKFELNRSGVSQLLKGQEIQGILNEHAASIRGRAGEGYAQDSRVGKTRANAMVYPDTAEAYFRNLKRNTLLKAMK